MGKFMKPDTDIVSECVMSEYNYKSIALFLKENVKLKTEFYLRFFGIIKPKT